MWFELFRHQSVWLSGDFCSNLVGHQPLQPEQLHQPKAARGSKSRYSLQSREAKCRSRWPIQAKPELVDCRPCLRRPFLEHREVNQLVKSNGCHRSYINQCSAVLSCHKFRGLDSLTSSEENTTQAAQVNLNRFWAPVGSQCRHPGVKSLPLPEGSEDWTVSKVATELGGAGLVSGS